MSAPIYSSYPNENSITKYPTAANFPLVGNSGDLAIALDTDTLYAYNTTSHSWVPIATPGAAIAIDALIGDVTATGPGSVPTTVNLVGGQTAADVAAATILVNSDTFVPFSGADKDVDLNQHSLVNASELSLNDGSGNNLNLFYLGGTGFKIESNDDLLIVGDGQFTLQPNSGILALSNAAIQFAQIAKPTPPPPSGNDYLYFKAGDLLVYQDSAGVEHSITTGSEAFTAGSIPFGNGTGLTQDNAKLFWDDTNFRLGVGTSSPAVSLDVQGTISTTGVINIPTTTSTVGQLVQDGVAILHSFGINAIYLGNNAGNFTNTGGSAVGIGTNALSSMTTPFDNTAVGWNSQQHTTTGSGNTSFGAESLRTNTTGLNSTALGNQALFTNNANNNVGVGNRAGYAVSSGINNTLVGTLAGQAINTGSNNTAVGEGALFTATNGTDNTAMAVSALFGLTTGIQNIAVGRSALGSLTTQSNNTAFGYRAANLAVPSTTNSFGEVIVDTAIGSQALVAATTGHDNVALGRKSLAALTSGAYNASLGSYTGVLSTTGSQNTIMGWAAGSAQVLYNQMTFLGTSADASVNNLTNSMALGYNASVSVSNFIQMGNTSVTGIGLPGFLDIPQSSTPATPASGHNRLFIDSNGNLYNLNSSGTKVQIGARVGTATLSAGSVVVSNTSVTSNTLIYLTVQSLGTITIPVAVAVTSTTPGTGFTISSADSADTSVVAYQLIEKA